MRLQTRGIDALGLDRSEYGETLRVLRPGPLHDWKAGASPPFTVRDAIIDTPGARVAPVRSSSAVVECGRVQYLRWIDSFATH